MKRLVLVPFCLAAGLAACGPRYEAIVFELKSQPPFPVRLEFNEIELPVGVAVSVHARLESSSSLEYVDEQLELVSEDRDIFEVEGVAGSGNFAFIGVAEGETCLSVLVDHAEEECIPVRVTAPPA